MVTKEEGFDRRGGVVSTMADLRKQVIKRFLSGRVVISTCFTACVTPILFQPGLHY